MLSTVVLNVYFSGIPSLQKCRFLNKGKCNKYLQNYSKIYIIGSVSYVGLCTYTLIKTTAFFKNGTLVLLRLKVLFSSSLFFALREKAPNYLLIKVKHITTNSNKVLIDFTHNFAHLAPGTLSVKSFFPVFDHPGMYHF